MIIALAVLFWRNSIGAVADVLRPHLDHVAAPLCGVEQEAEREPGLAADRVRGLVLRDLVVGPRVVSGRLHGRQLDAAGRVLDMYCCSSANWQSARSVLSQLRAACGFFLVSTAAMNFCGMDATG